MGSPATLRFDKEMRECVARIARERKVSTSKVIRDAVEAWLQREERVAAPYDWAADLLGVVNGGDPRRSARTGPRLTELLEGAGKRP